MRMGRAAATLILAAAAGCGPSRDVEPPRPAAPPVAAEPPPSRPAAPAMSEKEKARAEPYANDFGPASLPADLLAAYPPEIRKGYELTITRCAQCHTASRPLNSQLASSEEWRRYVKRMMAKPGCEIAPAEGKAIWAFLAHDSKTRKTGAAEAAWKAHRRALLAEFKATHPARYAVLYGGKPEE